MGLYEPWSSSLYKVFIGIEWVTLDRLPGFISKSLDPGEYGEYWVDLLSQLGIQVRGITKALRGVGGRGLD